MGLPRSASPSPPACSCSAGSPSPTCRSRREYTMSHVRILEGLRYMARNGPFVRLIAAYFINGLSNGIPATLFLYFVSKGSAHRTCAGRCCSSISWRD